MSFDTGAKRYFPVVVLAMIAAVAYFQASGVGDIVATSIAGGQRGAETLPPSLAAGAQDDRSGAPILARNPFDSVTGPLDGSPEPAPRPDAVEGEEEVASPPGEDGGHCDFGRVVLIAASGDSAWSFASIAGGDGKVKMRRLGDDVDGHVVQAFDWDRVWLQKGGERCHLKMGERRAEPAPPTRDAARTSRRPSRAGAKLSDELASKIHKVSDTEFNVERSVVEEIIQKQAELMQSTRLRPVKEGDEVVGLQMSRIRPGTLLDTLGIKNGDQVKSINGFSLTDPQKALEAYGRLRTADKLSLEVVRNGQPVNIDFNIQ